uniref:ATP synthase F0 subunit 8 n=1 Tax=Trigonopterus sp. 1 AH-2016 TaxID=1903835 RepID=A0A343C5C6_9CUCU|nr:ATP synthase F0 subunit 8 [Trigonopterus sp. 1 AH-2016]
MPQMAPLNWVYLYMIVISTFMTFLIINFFLFKQSKNLIFYTPYMKKNNFPSWK